MEAYVYPGSGATCDTALPEPSEQSAGSVPAPPAADAAAASVEEDPDHEFVPREGEEHPPSEGPRYG